MRPVFIVPIPLGGPGCSAGPWAWGGPLASPSSWPSVSPWALAWRSGGAGMPSSDGNGRRRYSGLLQIGVATRNDARPTITICNDVWVLLPARFARSRRHEWTTLPPPPRPHLC